MYIHVSNYSGAEKTSTPAFIPWRGERRHSANSTALCKSVASNSKLVRHILKLAYVARKTLRPFLHTIDVYPRRKTLQLLISALGNTVFFTHHRCISSKKDTATTYFSARQYGVYSTPALIRGRHVNSLLERCRASMGRALECWAV